MAGIETYGWAEQLHVHWNVLHVQHLLDVPVVSILWCPSEVFLNLGRDETNRFLAKCDLAVPFKEFRWVSIVYKGMKEQDVADAIHDLFEVTRNGVTSLFHIGVGFQLIGIE